MDWNDRFCFESHLYWPSTQLHHLVTHSWANWIWFDMNSSGIDFYGPLLHVRKLWESPEWATANMYKVDEAGLSLSVTTNKLSWPRWSPVQSKYLYIIIINNKTRKPQNSQLEKVAYLVAHQAIWWAPWAKWVSLFTIPGIQFSDWKEEGVKNICETKLCSLNLIRLNMNMFWLGNCF